MVSGENGESERKRKKGKGREWREERMMGVTGGCCRRVVVDGRDGWVL